MSAKFQRRTRFMLKWLTEKDDSDVAIGQWCRPVEGDDAKAFCLVCRKEISIAQNGVAAIKSHSRSDKHVRAMTQAGEVTSSQEAGPQLQVLKAELIWCLFTVEVGASFAASDDAAELFASMFPDSAVAAGLELGAERTEWLLREALFPFLQEQLCAQLRAGPFSVQLQIDSHLVIAVRFFPRGSWRPQLQLFDAPPLQDRRPESVAAALLQALREKEVPLENCVALQTSTSLAEPLQEAAPHLLHIPACSPSALQAAAQCAQEALDAPPLQELWYDLLCFFQSHPFDDPRLASAVDEELAPLQTFERLLQQLDALRDFFAALPAPSSRARGILEQLQHPLTAPLLQFASDALQPLRDLQEALQQPGLDPQALSAALHALLPPWLAHCRSGGAQEELPVGDTAAALVATLQSSERSCFFLQARKFLAAAAEEMESALPLADPLLRDLRRLQPREDDLEGPLLRLARRMPSVVPPAALPQLCLEARAFKRPAGVLQASGDAAQQWERALEDAALPTMRAAVRAALLLPLASAEAEELLRMRRAEEEGGAARERAFVRCYMRATGVACHEVPITQRLLDAASRALLTFRLREDDAQPEEAKRRRRLEEERRTVCGGRRDLEDEDLR